MAEGTTALGTIDSALVTNPALPADQIALLKGILKQLGGGAAPAARADGLSIAPVGIVASASFTPVAAAYSAGDVVGLSKEFVFTYADGSAIPAGSLIRILTTILKIDRAAVIASETSYTLHGYSATQPSAQADNAAWSLASADLASYRGSMAIGAPVDLGAALYVKTPLVNLDIKLATSSLWGRIVTVGNPTLTAEDLQVLLYGVVL